MNLLPTNFHIVSELKNKKKKILRFINNNFQNFYFF